MSNKEILQQYNEQLENNNNSLDNILEIINELPEAGEEANSYVLFDGEATNANITLYDDVSNYDYLEVFFRCNSGFYNSMKVYQPNGKYVVLTIIECNDSDKYFMNYKSKNVIISGNTITNQHSGEMNFKLSTKSIDSAVRNNNIFITRVIGIKNNDKQIQN